MCMYLCLYEMVHILQIIDPHAGGEARRPRAALRAAGLP